MKIDWRDKTNWLAVVLLCGVAFVVIYKMGNFWGLDKSTWAAWVQAIGSIVAIISAVGITQWQFAVERSEARIRPLRSLNAILDRANQLIGKAPDTGSNQNDVFGFAVLFDQRKFIDVLDALNEFPIENIQDYGAIEALFEMRLALQRIIALIEPYAMVEDANFIAQMMIEDLYPYETCKEAAGNAMLHMKAALGEI